MRITVVVPTYKRPDDLARCLNALKQQVRLAEEILVTVRDNDAVTWEFLDSFEHDALPLKLLTLDEPGQVFALNAGLAAATGDIIAITDDDAAPHANWLEKIEAHFKSNPQVGGVGGRDWVHLDESTVDTSESEVVGKVQWFGRFIGNHHKGVGPAREVDILKGANMSYRCDAVESLRFDDCLKGQGAQVRNDMAFSLAVRRAGWKIIYDPAVAVDHYPAQRFDEDQRNQFVYEAWKNTVHNETLAILRYLRAWQRIFFSMWMFLIGTCISVGLVQVIRLSLRRDEFAWAKYSASLRGQLLGWKTYLSSN